jgi:hypothetical protein
MFHRVLGFLDLLCIFALIFPLFNVTFTVVCALYLIIKGGVFTFHKDLISFLDVVVGFYLLALLFGFSNFILTVVAILFVLQKALFSFFG